jgi:hypothetical protein
MEVELQHEGLEDICSQKRLSENVKDMSKKFGQDSCMTCLVNGGPRSEKFGDLKTVTSERDASCEGKGAR